MASNARHATRNVIGGSNRRSEAVHAHGSGLMPPRPSTTEMIRSFSASSFANSISSGSQRPVGTPGDRGLYRRKTPSDLVRRAPRGIPPQLSDSGNVPVSSASVASSTGTGPKKLSGPQETALQVMTDFFSTRPLAQMRNAFRDADIDNSGELDLEEFQLAVRNMNTTLTDKDAKTIFLLADQDGGGTLGIDEFFNNFRHNKWPREKFFWDKQCGGGENLTKTERKQLQAKLDEAQQGKARKRTMDILKVLEEKVENHGSAEKVFRVLDTNLNGSLEVNEIADAIRPYEIYIDDEQAADVLTKINEIAGKPPLTDLTYNSFALAFNSTQPPSKLGGNFTAPGDRRRRKPTGGEDFDAPRRLGQLETIDQMKSISTLDPAGPLDHSASRGALTDQERALEDAQRTRYDQMSSWRGVDGLGYEEGDQLGTKHMKVGRDIDWHEGQRSSHSLYATRSTPTLLEAGVGSGDAKDDQIAFHDRGRSDASASSLGRSRSRLSLELESAGSRSTLECLNPGRLSHHHAEDSDRFLHTSSLASLRSISGPALNAQQDPSQVESRMKRTAKLDVLRARHYERGIKQQETRAKEEERAALFQNTKTQIAARNLKRMGEQQLLMLTRACENGKAPIWFERPAHPSWVPAPPHLTSHWNTISGGHKQLEDPPRQAKAGSKVSMPGRRAFPEERLRVHDDRPGAKVVWGGARE